MGGMYYLRVILLKKLEGMAPVPYPIQNRVKCPWVISIFDVFPGLTDFTCVLLDTWRDVECN